MGGGGGEKEKESKKMLGVKRGQDEELWHYLAYLLIHAFDLRITLRVTALTVQSREQVRSLTACK